MVNLTLQFITYIFQVAFLNIFYSGSPLLAFRPLSIIARSAGVKVSHSNSNILFHIFDQKSLNLNFNINNQHLTSFLLGRYFLNIKSNQGHFQSATCLCSAMADICNHGGSIICRKILQGIFYAI